MTEIRVINNLKKDLHSISKKDYFPSQIDDLNPLDESENIEKDDEKV